MQLDHATIVTDDIEGVRRFFEDVAGLETGPRPPFRVDGFWLYLNKRPVIHIVQAAVSASAGLGVPRIDHIALRIEDRDEWSALVERLREHQVPYQRAVVPISNELQLFVSVASGVHVEFVTASGIVEA